MPSTRRTVFSPSRFPAKWRRLLRLIPGYDPVATAGDCVFDTAAAQRALDFFPECLTHVKGELARDREPFLLEPWQQAIIANLFGWKRPDGTRRYRKGLIFVPCGNGKTTLIAGIALYLLFCDGEPGAEIYSVAGKRDQAAIAHDIAKTMIENEPELTRRAHIFKSTKRILYEASNSLYMPLAAEAQLNFGSDAHGVLFDELHVQPNAELYNTMISRMRSRRQPLFISVTTAGYDTESICMTEYNYACDIRDGTRDDPHYLPVIYEARHKDKDGKWVNDENWHSEKTWRKANPNYGISVRKDFLREQHTRAVQQPSFENPFRRLHLNQWTEQAERWLPLGAWDACTAPESLLEDLIGCDVILALDMGTIRDLTALLGLFPLEVPPGDDKAPLFYAHPWFFACEKAAHSRELHDRVPYLTWARQGHITLTQGDATDYEALKAAIRTVGDNHHVLEIAVDRWNAEQLAQQLDLEGLNPVKFGQGYASMSAPAKELERLLVTGRILVAPSPVLRWMAANVAVERDAADNIKPSKKKSNQRIDGIVALVMALGRALVADPAAGHSVYESQSIRLI